MARKRFPPEEIVSQLRLVHVMTSEGKSIAPAVKVIGVMETTYFSSGQTDQAASSPRISVST